MVEVLKQVELCRLVRDAANPNGLIPPWSLDRASELLDVRYAMGCPSLWYMAWYLLSGEDMDVDDSVSMNPLVVMRVCEFEWEQRLGEMHVSPMSEQAHDAHVCSYLDESMVSRMFARKGLNHQELTRAQKLHVAFSITRPMYLASKELGVDGSNSQMQRKWLPDVWVEHLVSNVFKLLVNQLLLLDRWFPDFISNNVVFASKLHTDSVRMALSAVSVGVDVRALCVISHSEAVILRPTGVDVPHEILWRGPIGCAVSAWIAGSGDTALQNQTRSLSSSARIDKQSRLSP